MSQVERLYQLLQDGQPHRSDALVRDLYGVGDGVWLARLGARIWDVKQRYQVTVRSYPERGNRKLWWYQLVWYQPVPHDITVAVSATGDDDESRVIRS